MGEFCYIRLRLCPYSSLVSLKKCSVRIVMQLKRQDKPYVLSITSRWINGLAIKTLEGCLGPLMVKGSELENRFIQDLSNTRINSGWAIPRKTHRVRRYPAKSLRVTRNRNLLGLRIWSPRPQRCDAGPHSAISLNPVWLLAGEYRDVLRCGLLWLPGPDRSSYPAPPHHRPQRLWPGDDAAGQYLVSLAGGQGRQLCPGDDRQSSSLHQRDDAVSQSKSSRRRTLAWVEFMLHSHPSISKRVAMAQSFRVEK
jgi:hypothetical protein